ncbi:MAG: hypothetical protein R6U51_04000 [Anaerolineales bacterium]
MIEKIKQAIWIALVNTNAVEDIIHRVREAYKDATGEPPTIHPVEACQGVERLF